uniref:cholesterol 7-desaturase n=1 Tax=Parastrongyloides trichosuri TaxID=131310 RepID=A0A0N4ZMH8_PARTI
MVKNNITKAILNNSKDFYLPIYNKDIWKQIFYFIFIFLIYIGWRLLVKPLNRVKRLGDLGFFFGDAKYSNKVTEKMIERVKRLRIIGELPPVYPNGWFCIAESNQINKKSILPVTFMGEQLSLVRSESGDVFLIDSYCPHLGASFSVGGKVVNDNCVQCPFHGWIFSAETGKCTSIPYNEASIPEQAKVSTWHVIERNNAIFVWYHAEGDAPTWEIPEIYEVKDKEWSYNGRTEHEIMCHIQEVPENGADLAHLDYLHLHGIQEGNDVTKIPMNISKPYIRHVWDGSWEAKNGDEKHISVMHLYQIMKAGNFSLPLTETKLDAIQYGPGIVHMMFDFGILGKGIVFQYLTPEEPMFQRSRFNMYTTVPKLWAKFMMLSEAFQFERDIFIWSNKKYIKNPLYVKNDGPINKHRKWFQQFYSENSPRLEKNGTLTCKVKSTLDW